MNMKYYFLLLSLLFSLGVNAQKVSVLGDSYSTFKDQVNPSWNAIWYGTEYQLSEGVNDVRTVEQTWWHQVIKGMNYTLEQNNSWSGSTVCYTGYNGEWQTNRAFITRVQDLGNPDIILICGGTNDSWAGAPIGNYVYSNWTREQLFAFRPAFAYMLDYLVRNYPKARIVNICNSELSEAITQSQAEICAHYHIENVQLQNVDKQNGHPSIAGMKAMAEQVMAVLKK